MATEPQALLRPEPRAVQKMMRYRWYMFALLAAAYMLVTFHRMSTAVISGDLVKTFNISAVSLGVLGSAYFYPYAIMQIPAGIFADSIGPRRLTSISFCLAGAGCLLFAYAPSFPVAVLARFLIGMGLSCVYVPTLKIFSVWFRTNEFATLTGILNSVGSLGSLIAAAPLAFIVAGVGWRQAILVIGIATMFIAAAVYLVVRNDPQDMGLPTLADIDGVPLKSRVVTKTPTLEGLKTVVSNKYAWILFVRGFTATASSAALQALWGVPFMISVYNMTRMQASSTIMLMSVGSLITSPIGGYLSDKVLRSRKKLWLGAACVNYCFWIPLAFFTDKLSPRYLAVQFLCMGLTFGLGMGAAFAMAKELFPPSLTGTANGVNNFFSMSGSAIFQVVIGAIIQSYSSVPGVYPPEAFHTAYLFVFGCLTVSLVLAFFAKETMVNPKIAPREVAKAG